MLNAITVGVWYMVYTAEHAKTFNHYHHNKAETITQQNVHMYVYGMY